MNGKKKRKRRWLAAALIVLLAGVVGLGLYVWRYGWQDRYEYNSATLETQVMRSYHLPKYRWRVWGPFEVDRRESVLGEWLIGRSLLSGSDGEWIVFHGARPTRTPFYRTTGGRPSEQFHLLVQIVDLAGYGTESAQADSWLEWSKNYPEAADVYWRYVLETLGTDPHESYWSAHLINSRNWQAMTEPEVVEAGIREVEEMLAMYRD